MTRRVFSAILVLLMVITMLPATAIAVGETASSGAATSAGGTASSDITIPVSGGASSGASTSGGGATSSGASASGGGSSSTTVTVGESHTAYLDQNSFSSPYSLTCFMPNDMISGSEETIMLAYYTEEWKTIDSIRIYNQFNESEYIVANNNGDDTFTFTVPSFEMRIGLGEEHDSFQPYTVTIGGKSFTVSSGTGYEDGVSDMGWSLYSLKGVANLNIFRDFTGSIVSEGPLTINVNRDCAIQGEVGKPAIDVAGNLVLLGSNRLSVKGAAGQSAICVGKRLEVGTEVDAEGGAGASGIICGSSAKFYGYYDVTIRSGGGSGKALDVDRRWLVPYYSDAEITQDTDDVFELIARRYTLTLQDTDGAVLKRITGLRNGDMVSLSDYIFEKQGKVLVGWIYNYATIPPIGEINIYEDRIMTAQWEDPGDGVIAYYQNGDHSWKDVTYYDVIPAGKPLPNTRNALKWDSETQSEVLTPINIVAWATDLRRGNKDVLTGACYLSGSTVPEGGFNGQRILYSLDADTYYRLTVYHPTDGTVKVGGDVLVQTFGGLAPGGEFFNAPYGKYLAGWSLTEGSDQIDREIGSWPGDNAGGAATHLYAVWKDAVPYTRATFVAELMDKKYSGYGLPNGITIPEDCASLDEATQKKIASAIFQGYVNTDESGNFRPDDSLARAQVAMIVARAARGRNAFDALIGNGDLFTDVPAEHWACGVIEFAVNEQVMFGRDGAFYPQEQAKTGDVVWENLHVSSYSGGGGGGGGTGPAPSVPITVTLTLQGKGGICDGAGEIQIPTFTHQGFSLEDYLFTREGYVFAGWLNENNNEQYGADEWIYLSEDTTLVAQWVKIGAGIQLADPSNLEWGKDYRTWWDADNVMHEYEEIPGMVSWKINPPSQNEYRLIIYRVGSGGISDEEVYWTTWHLGSTHRMTYHSASHFINDDMDSGTYYFTVQALGDGSTYLDSQIVRSENWTYVRPNRQLPAPTGLKWDTESDVTVRWNAVNSDDVLSYEVKFYAKDASEETGYRLIGSTWGHSADMLETDLFDEALQDGGDNDYYFRVRTISRDITTIRSSAYSPMSAVRHLPRIGGDDAQGQAKQESVDSAVNNLESVLEQMKNDDIAEETKQELKEQAIESAKDTLKNDLGTETVREALLTATNSAEDSNSAKVENLIKQAESLSGVETTAQAKIDENYNAATATEQEKKEVQQLQEAAAGASMIGAALNAEGNSSVELQISKPDQNTERVIPEAYNNTLVVSFSMDLVGKSDGQDDVIITKDATGGSKQLDIPVKLRIPVPTGINPQFLVILHHDMSGNVDEVLMPYIDYEDGKAYATFVLTHFSDFSFVEARVTFKDGGDKVNVTAKLPGNAEAAMAFCAAYDENGKMLAISGTEQLQNGTVYLTLPCALADVHHGKIFFVDANGKPVAAAELFERE